ncbi:hypothetical protein I5G22_30065, partial [Pseudomonas aeruginosa]|nr:hypothetical protein [Pseudomonas aeruginosa]
MLTTLAVSNYRTLRNLVMPLRRLNLIAGAHGARPGHRDPARGPRAGRPGRGRVPAR